MDAGVDTGAIAHEVRVPIHEDDKIGLTLSARCARQGLLSSRSYLPPQRWTLRRFLGVPGRRAAVLRDADRAVA